ncbi:MAG: para-aminobenzoate synthetase component 1 [Psychromonas sp.]|jgi:para-aminobenzoate synthetase component 1|uniref:aminodeoxychorismate synthase component I n=1 Tax=Psychromonas sp. TaxID=1884585 RepID=UPI0039E55C44
MTNCTANILIKPISLTHIEFSNLKHQIAGRDWGILLESADTAHIDSRWSIYSAQPIATLQTFNGITKVEQNNHCSEQKNDPFEILHSLRSALFHDTATDHKPFTGGALGSIAYEQGYQFEKITDAHKPQGLNLPDMAIGFYDWALVYDNQDSQFHLIVHKTKDKVKKITDLWSARLTWLKKQSRIPPASARFKLDSSWSANMDKQLYRKKFNKIQNYILSGDCYQVNLAQRFQAAYQGDEYQAYQALFNDNKPPFGAFLRLPSQVILSLSPERFLKLHNGVVESKPIKGTRPRFKNAIQDKNSRQALIDSEKDRAENLMIVDLLRNDIGRVCEPGSVSVPKLFDLESFPAVHHLVSTVLGKLATNYSTEELLRVCFPGGSITGAPKIRAMEIIAELEPDRRHQYCGSIGYINGDGQMDTNISIRTLVCHKQKIFCWAGGGLVAESVFEQEYQECFDKVSKILPCLEALNNHCK